MQRKYIFVVAGVFVALLLVVVGAQALSQSYTLRGSAIEPPVPASDFVLDDQHGQDFRLSDYQGKVVVMAFGYTHCPDVCPATLAEFKRIHTQLGRQSDRVQFVFVTVDPERDTPEYLARYVQAFDPAFLGLSGSLSSLEQVWDSYGVYREKQHVGSAAGYLVDHTSRVYVVDVQGNLRVTYAFGTSTSDMVQDIRYLAEESV